MKFGTMLRDVSSSLVKKPVTERYPAERREVAVRLRGRLHYDPEKCIGCDLCAKDCPAMALELIVLDKKAKRFVLTYHVDRCTFCAQCVESCRHGCLELVADEWELASLTRDAFTYYYGEEQDVREFLAGPVAAVAGRPEES
jgi:formate hydrogenlyase subunit 6/NADH:ubiquinone oxidoreductase subunit I